LFALGIALACLMRSRRTAAGGARGASRGTSGRVRLRRRCDAYVRLRMGPTVLTPLANSPERRTSSASSNPRACGFGSPPMISTLGPTRCSPNRLDPHRGVSWLASHPTRASWGGGRRSRECVSLILCSSSLTVTSRVSAPSMPLRCFATGSLTREGHLSLTGCCARRRRFSVPSETTSSSLERARFALPWMVTTQRSPPHAKRGDRSCCSNWAWRNPAPKGGEIEY
jgi:hypothetical protein